MTAPRLSLAFIQNKLGRWQFLLSIGNDANSTQSKMALKQSANNNLIFHRILLIVVAMNGRENWEMHFGNF
jgi:hypothetical protein